LSTELQEKHVKRIAMELGIRTTQVESTAKLLDEGATVPFISRYRKEATGTLDEVEVTAVRDRLKQLRELDERREAILASLEERELLTDELRAAIMAAETMTELEDIYLPYRPKRRTRATIARERGLEPLSELIYGQTGVDPLEAAAGFVDPEQEVESVEDALAGARDIIAENIAEERQARESMRELFNSRGVIRSKMARGKEAEGAKYRDYFEWEEQLSKAPSHRVLAMRRGENEGFLSLRFQPDEDEALDILSGMFVRGTGEDSSQVRQAVDDGYKRLLAPSIETEIRGVVRELAETDAISVFASNLRELLLAPPLGGKPTLAIDPGFRTGCKVCCLDAQGKLLAHDAIFPHPPQQKKEASARTVKKLIAEHGSRVIAVGNGTAGRETEDWLRSLDLPDGVQVVLVDEAGASVYSASEVAREEFPDHDLTVRGAVSIGRRLMDPLAELVKIEPRSIGVGQYQHDVDQKNLKQGLDDVVISCVNRVGVELNTASSRLLTYVSGLGPRLAKEIVKFRDKNGPFSSREQLNEVAYLGPKAFEQAAGFLRIHDGENPLDASAVHPERYGLVEQMAADSGCAVAELIRDEPMRAGIKVEKYVGEDVGLPTLEDIMTELARPGRDPRPAFEPFSYAKDVNSMEDLEPGMRLPGIVTNITNFGAFVDIGVHQDGLVHISQVADKFVKDIRDEIKLRQQVSVTVVSVDMARKRIALSMKKAPEIPQAGAKG
jgi:protein Tex